MKKSLIALAVLAASGAAMAQSSVTLYGVADAFVGSTKTEINGAGQRQTAVTSGGVNGSRWGLKGAEDLGGGMKAIFVLESGFNLDTGSSAQNGQLFGRQAFVGLQSDFGTVSLGRQYSAYYALQTATNHNYDANTFSASIPVFGNGLKDYTSRVDNSIAYTSPSFSGFSGAVVYSFGENKNAPATATPAFAGNVNGDATDNASLHIKYANGPVLVGYAYQEEKLAAVAGAQDKNKYNMIAGSYDLGVAKLTGSYNTAKNNTFNDKEYQVGVSVPFGAAAISAGYARSKSERGNVEQTGKGYSVLATYDLSKRTRLYAGAQNTESFVGFTAASAPKTEITTYGLGVRHAF
ncbi:porin [Polaromonas sp. DSR2-3-2]|uniref:porin n=1 Tax=unclassified Polaromonas TaxID=2638319 RepID=UPI003CF9F996